MKIQKLKPVTRCDNGCCGKNAEYVILRDDTPLAESLRLCEDCIKQIVLLGSEAFGTGKPEKILSDKTKVSVPECNIQGTLK